jgi:Uma2 family endonuclease
MALPKAIADQLGTQTKLQPASLDEVIPPLENGDRLTRAEFERRYNAMPPHIKAELIEGEVYMSSPVRYRSHGKPHRQIITLLGNYSDLTPSTDCVDNATFRLDEDNEPQPDVALFIEPEAGGQPRVAADDILEAAPELVVEVAASTVSVDLHKKLNTYRRNGVREYLVWRVRDAEFDWFVWESGKYVRLHPDAKGVIRSRVFPGLWLNVRALLKGEMKKVQATLQQGLASKEHAAFVRKLKQQARAKR